jgi:phage/plasmid-like protein (TIGR03299 family)
VTNINGQAHSSYRSIDETPLANVPQGEAVTFAGNGAQGWRDGGRGTLGFYGADLGSRRPTEGRVPAFLGLAERTGGVYIEDTDAGLTAGDALRRAGLDFEVRKDSITAARTAEAPVVGDDGSLTLEQQPTGEHLAMPAWAATVAYPKDGGQPFAIAPCSPSYSVFQNEEALAVGDSISGGRLIAVGAYGRPVGARVYAAWELGEGMEVAGDPYRNFVTVVTTHDRSGTYALLAPIRLGCTNQTNATFGKRATPRFSIRHVGDMQYKADEARRILGLSQQYLDTFKESMEELLTVKITKDDFVSYARKLWGVSEDDEDLSKRSLVLAQARDEELLAILAGQTCAFGEGTAYQAYQAVTEYMDWHGTVRGGDSKDARRQERIMAGELDKAKTRAYDLALALA